MEYLFQNLCGQLLDQGHTAADPTGTAANAGRKQPQGTTESPMQFPDQSGFFDHLPIPGLAASQMYHQSLLLRTVEHFGSHDFPVKTSQGIHPQITIDQHPRPLPLASDDQNRYQLASLFQGTGQ